MINGIDTTQITGPVPVRDERSAAFFDGLRREELLIRRCASCEHLAPAPATACGVCGGTVLTWEKASGAAQLVTWSVVHSAPHAALRDQVPFLTGIVELAEGPWLYARLMAPTATLRVGLELRVAYVHPSEGESYPVFVGEEAPKTLTA